MSGPGAALA